MGDVLSFRGKTVKDAIKNCHKFTSEISHDQKSFIKNADQSFLVNDKKLSHVFTYDLISHQLHLLARRREYFIIPPSEDISTRSALLLKHLLHYSGNEKNLQQTLLYQQIKELLADYLADRQNH